MTPATVHASAAVVGGRCVLIRGVSGSGKSSLLLALLTSRDADATLIADDRVALDVERGELIAAAPATIAGLMEIRGVGIVRRDYVARARIDLVVDLMPLAECPRLPDEDAARVLVDDVSLPRIFIAIGATDGVARVLGALASMRAAIVA